MTHYSATSLEQIADELERRANLLDDIADRLPSMSGKRGGLREAATLVRNTRLADPAMEAMVQLVIQYRDDLRHPPAKDSIERRLASIAAAFKLVEGEMINARAVIAAPVLIDAILAVVAATRAYLPPDGIDAQECISRILAATDNPEINPIILEAENAS